MKKTSPQSLAKKLNISPGRGLEAIIKAKLISAILNALEETGTTHQEIAKRSGVPRSAVTAILSGSLQKVSLDRVLRLLEAANLTAQVTVKKAA
jgi:predicted XRE-type DNA-binding protein